LKARIGDSSGITDGRIKATWTAADRTTLSPDDARTLLDADTLAKISRTTNVRTLRVTTTKD
jgi:hypothetical protein